jgi:hypothetical protein
MLEDVGGFTPDAVADADLERSRVVLAVKLFPGSLLWANGVFLLARIGAGMWAVLLRGMAEAFPRIPSTPRTRPALLENRTGLRELSESAN